MQELQVLLKTNIPSGGFLPKYFLWKPKALTDPSGAVPLHLVGNFLAFFWQFELTC